MSDFKNAAHNAMQHMFPGARLVGCLFHLGQCLWKSSRIGSITTVIDDESHMVVKMMLALSFVPSNDVVDSFEEFVEAGPYEIMPLTDYWEDTYIGQRRRNCRTNLRLTVDLWNVHDCIIENLSCTNSSVEAWHCALQ